MIVKVRAPAKVNPLFHVGARRSDGFHELLTLFQAVSLYDDVTVSEADELEVQVAGDPRIGARTVPRGADNLAGRAVLILARYTGHEPGVAVRIHKRIPVAGGMAGGSADAAAVLVACDRLWGTGVSGTELSALAADLGSDVPFILHGGAALGRGRGEKLEPVPSTGTFHWVIAATDAGLLTADVYRAHGTFRERAGSPTTLPHGLSDEVRSALAMGDAKGLAASLHSDIQATALRLRPELAQILDFGLKRGALNGIVSGTGPTCAFLAASADDAISLQAHLTGLKSCTRVTIVSGPVSGIEVIA